MVSGVNNLTQGVQLLAQPASCVDSVLRHGYTWSMANDSALKNIAARTLIPVVAAVAAVIDTVGNIVAAALKMLVLPLNVVVSVITYLLPGYQVGIDPSLTPYAILANLYRAAASVAFVAIGPLLSFASPSSALDLARFASLAAAPQPAPVELTRWEQFRQNFPEDSFWAKTKYVASEAFKASVDGVSSAASSVKYHTWTRWENQRLEQLGISALVLVGGYAAIAVWKKDALAPVTLVRDGAAAGWESLTTSATALKDRVTDLFYGKSQKMKEVDKEIARIRLAKELNVPACNQQYAILNWLGFSCLPTPAYEVEHEKAQFGKVEAETRLKTAQEELDRLTKQLPNELSEAQKALAQKTDEVGKLTDATAKAEGQKAVNVLQSKVTGLEKDVTESAKIIPTQQTAVQIAKQLFDAATGKFESAKEVVRYAEEQLNPPKSKAPTPAPTPAPLDPKKA